MPADTPVTLDARQEVIYGDVMRVLDLVVSRGFEQIAFSGSFEES